ncbi:hypothetical protein ABLG96_00815 [Nakamurella sp. A5-74]|uniref:Uncharacterized protein n=1 Tax=Nakamurella sp. A5-74 TaxID=3158264 RepID=A0AAU8DSV1_9ACTN
MTTDPDDQRRTGGGLWLNGAPIDAATGTRAVAPQARTLNLLAGSLMAVPVILAVVLVVIGGTDGGAPELLPTVVPIAVGLLAAVGITTIGFRVRPLDQADVGRGAETAALQRFTTSFFLRFALAEMPALVALALAFAFPPVNLFAYLPGGLFALLLMAIFVRPNRSNVGRVERVLDERGARSNLSAAFGY